MEHYGSDGSERVVVTVQSHCQPLIPTNRASALREPESLNGLQLTTHPPRGSRADRIQIVYRSWSAVKVGESRLGDLCIGIATNERDRWAANSESGQPCPLGNMISLETAVLCQVVSALAERNLAYYVLRMPPRCLHCEVMRCQVDQTWTQKEGRLCQIQKCMNQRWQGVGILCAPHYLLSLHPPIWKTEKSVPDPPPPISGTRCADGSSKNGHTVTSLKKYRDRKRYQCYAFS